VRLDEGEVRESLCEPNVRFWSKEYVFQNDELAINRIKIGSLPTRIG